MMPNLPFVEQLARVRSRFAKVQAAVQRNRVLVGSSVLYVSERLLSACVSLAVFVALARCYAPQEFGMWSYTLGIVQFAASFLAGAAEPIIVARLISDRQKQGEVLGSAACVLALTAAVAVSVPALFVMLSHPNEPSIRSIALLAAISYLPQCFLLIEHFFRAAQRPWRIVVPRLITTFAAAAAKLWVAVSGLPIATLGWVLLIEALLHAALLTVSACTSREQQPRWTANWVTIRSLALTCWPAMLSGLVVTLFFRINYLLMERLSDFREIGFYAFAFNIVQLLTMIPSLAMVGLYPRLVDLFTRDPWRFRVVMRWLYFGGAVFGYMATAGVVLLGPWLIPRLFGSRYAEALPVLAAMFLSLVFLVSGTVRASIINVQMAQRLHLWSALIGLAVLVPTGFLLIPVYGALGAAIAILVSSLASAVLTSFLFLPLQRFAREQAVGLLLLTPFLRWHRP